MYFFSFIKALLKPRRILSTIYFLANLVLIFFIFGWLDLISFGTQYDFCWNGAVGIAIHFVLLLFALSPVGEAILRASLNAKPLTDPRAEAIFREVYAQASKIDRKLDKKVKLYVIEDDSVNAFALGHRTVILLRGALALDDATLKGVVAHEFGHISYGDSDLKLGIYVANSILSVLFTIYSVLITFISLFVAVVTKNGADLVQLLLLGLVTLFYDIWVGLGFLLENATSRKQEYAADRFAVLCGYGENLYDFLSRLDPSGKKMSLLALLCSTHPDTERRLKNIRECAGMKSEAAA